MRQRCGSSAGVPLQQGQGDNRGALCHSPASHPPTHGEGKGQRISLQGGGPRLAPLHAPWATWLAHPLRCSPR